MAEGKVAPAEYGKLDRGLLEALDQTFPASDPFSVGQFTATEHPSRPADRKSPLIGPASTPRAPGRKNGRARPWRKN